MSKRGDSPAADIPDTTHSPCWVRRALARGTFMSSLVWQTEKLRTARGTFCRNSSSLYKGKSFGSPSSHRQFGSCLLRNFRGCWGWWSWISARMSPPLPWSVSSRYVSLNLTFRSLLLCVAPRKTPSTQFLDQQNSFWMPWSSPEYSSYRMQCIREHSAHQSKASMSWPSSEGNISLIFSQWLQHNPGTRRDKLNQGIS